MKKSFLTCAGSLVLVLVVVVVGGIAGFNLIRDSFKTSVLQELGFSSQAEYDEFTAKLNESFDETAFYQHTYADVDKVSVKDKLSGAITFADGSALFLENGYFDIDALEKDNNARVTSALEFTDKEYSYFAQLLLASIYHSNEEENAALDNFQIISLVINADGTHTLVMKLSTATMKKSMKSYGSALPSSLFLRIDYSIAATAATETVRAQYKIASASMQVNQLNATYNTKCNTFLNKVFNTQDAAAEFAKIFISLTNAFDTATDATTTFAHDAISVTA